MTVTAEQAALPFETFEEELISPLKGHELSEVEMYVASLLLGATSEKPMTMAKLKENVFDTKSVQLSDRQVRITIRSLRRDHAFPILSRRAKPNGYWWCRSFEEMEEFATLWQSQYFDEIRTLSVIIKHNYPRLAGQLRLADLPQE